MIDDPRGRCRRRHGGPVRLTSRRQGRLADAGIRTVLSGVRIPRMNSIMERWVQELRHELLDRTLIWNQRHLLRALREFEDHHNRHRPHQAMDQAAPLRPVPNRSPIRHGLPAWTYADTTASEEASTNTDAPPDLHGLGFRQAQGSVLQRHTLVAADNSDPCSADNHGRRASTAR